MCIIEPRRSGGAAATRTRPNKLCGNHWGNSPATHTIRPCVCSGYSAYPSGSSATMCAQRLIRLPERVIRYMSGRMPARRILIPARIECNRHDSLSERCVHVVGNVLWGGHQGSLIISLWPREIAMVGFVEHHSSSCGGGGGGASPDIVLVSQFCGTWIPNEIRANGRTVSMADLACAHGLDHKVSQHL